MVVEGGGGVCVRYITFDESQTLLHAHSSCDFIYADSNLKQTVGSSVQAREALLGAHRGAAPRSPWREWKRAVEG